ncbi:hypothetical protein ZWY2020_012421 [Hordeum vulgare]|nr:hypothetical protein ZWY2020_012421 [Hordeum vulgare]
MARLGRPAGRGSWPIWSGKQQSGFGLIPIPIGTEKLATPPPVSFLATDSASASAAATDSNSRSSPAFDVLRTDRSMPFYEKKENHPFLAVYECIDKQVGYCQGFDLVQHHH